MASMAEHSNQARSTPWLLLEEALAAAQEPRRAVQLAQIEEELRRGNIEARAAVIARYHLRKYAFDLATIHLPDEIYNRERWITTGAGMVVVDTLLHNHLHRTGTLRRFRAEHPCGPRCYAPGGCSDLIRGLAERVDAREFNPTFPACFPRFVQFAVWRLCSTSELDFCNGNRIDDRDRCGNAVCPAFSDCDRVALYKP